MSEPQNTESGFDDTSLPQAPVASANPDPSIYAGAGLTISARTERTGAVDPSTISMEPSIIRQIEGARNTIMAYPEPKQPELQDAINLLGAAAKRMREFFDLGPA